MRTGKYNNVKNLMGARGKAYATSNHIEYFSEVAVPFFSSNKLKNFW